MLKNRLAVVALGVLLAVFWTAGAEAMPAKKLAVLNLKMERGLDKGLVKLLNELLLTEFQRSGAYEVIGGSDIESMLRLEEKKLMMQCSDVSCFAEVGGSLGVEMLAIGSIGKIGSTHLVNVKLIDIRSAKVKGRVTYKVDGTEEKLVQAITNAVRELVTGKRQPAARPDSDDMRTWGHVSFWSGAALVAAGGVVMALGIGAADDYEGGDYGSKDDARMYTGMMWAGYGIGAALMVTGAVLWALSGEEGDQSLGLAPSRDGAGWVFSLGGRW